MHEELLVELYSRGFPVTPGALGENVLTRGVGLLALPRGTRLRLGASAMWSRNPCAQLDQFAAGSRAAVLDRDARGNLVRKAGIMAIVVAGVVAPADSIEIELQAPPHEPLAVV